MSRDPLTPMCPPSPLVLWGSAAEPGCQDEPHRPPPRWPRMPPSCRVRGRGQRWAQTPGPTCQWHFCSGKAGMRQRSGGEKAFRSDLGYFCRAWSGGFCFGDESRQSPFAAAPRCKPSRATETLGFSLLGLKGSESTKLGNKLGFLFLFPPQTGEGRASSSGSPRLRPFLERRTPALAPLCPVPAPAALSSGGKLLLKPLPLVWTLSFRSLIVKWLFCNDICLLIKETS